MKIMEDIKAAAYGILSAAELLEAAATAFRKGAADMKDAAECYASAARR
jgi:hypothetical protein